MLMKAIVSILAGRSSATHSGLGRALTLGPHGLTATADRAKKAVRSFSGKVGPGSSIPDHDPPQEQCRGATQIKSEQ